MVRPLDVTFLVLSRVGHQPGAGSQRERQISEAELRVSPEPCEPGIPVSS